METEELRNAQRSGVRGVDEPPAEILTFAIIELFNAATEFVVTMLSKPPEHPHLGLVAAVVVALATLFAD